MNDGLRVRITLGCMIDNTEANPIFACMNASMQANRITACMIAVMQASSIHCACDAAAATPSPF